MKNQLFRWVCDRCGRAVEMERKDELEDEKPPIGWRVVRCSAITGSTEPAPEPLFPQELCGACIDEVRKVLRSPEGVGA